MLFFLLLAKPRTWELVGSTSVHKCTNPVKLQSENLSKSGEVSVECLCSPQLNLKWAISSIFGPVVVLVIAATHYQRRFFYIDKGDIRYSKYTAVCWQGSATFSAGVERCSALTITWLNVTENDWDEAEPVTFSGEPFKTAMPIPFTKELSSCQMMRVMQVSLFFFPTAALHSCFGIWKPTYYNLWTCAEAFFFLSHWWRWLWQLAADLGNVVFCVKYSVKSMLLLHGSHGESNACMMW